jgi:hypothetical protein
MQWKIDFVAFKGSKYTISFPVDCESVKNQEISKSIDIRNVDVDYSAAD